MFFASHQSRKEALNIQENSVVFKKNDEVSCTQRRFEMRNALNYKKYFQIVNFKRVCCVLCYLRISQNFYNSGEI